MTRQQLNQTIAAILTTLDECGGWSPASSIYMALGMDIHAFNDIRSLLVASELITATSEVITLTEKGKQIAEKCNALVA